MTSTSESETRTSAVDVLTLVGVWLTALIYVVLAVVAIWQLREARRLRVHQMRPYVLVGVTLYKTTVDLDIRNIGQTAARELRVRFDALLTGAYDLVWLESAPFGADLPLMPPGGSVTYPLDIMQDRQLRRPMTISGTVSYSSDVHEARIVERFEIDLEAYSNTWQGPPDLTDVKNEIAKLTKQIKSTQHMLSVREAQSELLSPPPPATWRSRMAAVLGRLAVGIRGNRERKSSSAESRL